MSSGCQINKLCDNDNCKSCYEKSFASHEKAKYWSDKNELKPRFVFKKNSHNTFIFNCNLCNHEFNGNLYNINKFDCWCPYCSIPASKLCKDNCNQCYDKSFAKHEKAKYWSDKNELKPHQVFRSSSKKYIFNCNVCQHEFISGLDNIINGKWCSYCANQKLCSDNNCNICFEKSFASHEKAKYWSNKNELTPRQVFKNSNIKFLFDCECKHEINIALNNGNWCSFCSNPPKQLCSEDNCNICFEKSFASNEKAKYWSNKNELTSRQVFKSSGKKYIFNCNDCNHEIELSLRNISSGNWCSYCANQKLCYKNTCNYCFEKSFASHEKAKYWSDKNELKPINVFKFTNLKYIFDCHICNHSFENNLNNICSKEQWCPYCSKPCSQLCLKDCSFCFNNSFASHEKSKEFSNKNNINPRFIFKGSHKKYIFNCNQCNHEYETIIGNESWCPYCVNKTEQKLYDDLLPLYPNLIHQFRIEWCKNKTFLPFDFVLEDIKIIIELDGRQHFKQVRDWKSPEEQQKTDKYKMLCANNNGFSVIRILQEDVYYDSYDWLNELKCNIDKISKENKIQNIYMCKNNEYNIFNK